MLVQPYISVTKEESKICVQAVHVQAVCAQAVCAQAVCTQAVCAQAVCAQAVCAQAVHAIEGMSERKSSMRLTYNLDPGKNPTLALKMGISFE